MCKVLEKEFKIVKNAPEKYWIGIYQKVIHKFQWSHSIYDYEINRKSLDYTLYFAIDKENDEAVGTISLTKMALVDQPRPRQLALIGNFCVLPEYRRRGLGGWLADAMFKDANDDKFAISVARAWEKHRDTYGFDKMANYHLDFSSALCSDLRVYNLKSVENLQIVDWKAVDYDKLCAYDSGITRCDRADYLANTFSQPKSTAKVAVDVHGEILGICRARMLLNHNVNVGPLYAQDTNIASSLLRSCVECVFESYGSLLNAESRVLARIPSANAAALELFRKLAHDNYSKELGIIQYSAQLVEMPISTIYFYGDACPA